MTENPQYERETCYFCHEPDTHLLETHHIVPRRFDGSDDAENLVTVCPTCHERLERLYDNRFYAALGVEPESDDENNTDSEIPDHKNALFQATDGELKLIDLIDSLAADYRQGAPVSEVSKRAEKHGVDRTTIGSEIERLRRQGDVYEPTSGHLRTV